MDKSLVLRVMCTYAYFKLFTPTLYSSCGRLTARELSYQLPEYSANLHKTLLAVYIGLCQQQQ